MVDLKYDKRCDLARFSNVIFFEIGKLLAKTTCQIWKKGRNIWKDENIGSFIQNRITKTNDKVNFNFSQEKRWQFVGLFNPPNDQPLLSWLCHFSQG